MYSSHGESISRYVEIQEMEVAFLAKDCITNKSVLDGVSSWLVEITSAHGQNGFDTVALLIRKLAQASKYMNSSSGWLASPSSRAPLVSTSRVLPPPKHGSTRRL